MLMRFRAWYRRPIVARVERSLPHPRERLYGILVDFQDHHRRVTSHSLDSASYRIESGGVGDGTIVVFASVLGANRAPKRYRIVESHPGRTIEIVAEDGVNNQRYQVVDAEEGRTSVVTMTWWANHSDDLVATIRNTFSRFRAERQLEEKMDNLDQYAATLGNNVFHAPESVYPDHAVTTADW